MDLHVAETAHDAAAEAAAFIAKKVWPAVRKRGRFTMAVSGGTTPVPLFEALVAEDLPWGTVHIYQVDERIAPKGHADRNANQLVVFPVPSTNLHLIDVEWGDHRLVTVSYAAALPEQFDVVQLGLGDDGHTASWPPGDDVVDATAPVAAVGPFHGRSRYTLTPAVVNGARFRVMFVTGAAKAGVVSAWVGGDSSLPASRLKRAGTAVFLDRPAAAALQG